MVNINQNTMKKMENSHSQICTTNQNIKNDLFSTKISGYIFKFRCTAWAYRKPGQISCTNYVQLPEFEYVSKYLSISFKKQILKCHRFITRCIIFEKSANFFTELIIYITELINDKTTVQILHCTYSGQLFH